MNVDPTLYRKAFQAYLRRGTPIEWSIKQETLPELYVWRTREDEKVRPAHAMNAGRVFNRNEPPSTGHPGSEFNCRCEAVSFISGHTEFAYLEFDTSLASAYNRWTDVEFVSHYYFGNGQSVDLLEIGHLREIAEEYAWEHGAFRRLCDQIADTARRARQGKFAYDFRSAYDFGAVAFSHGNGIVLGQFTGSVLHESGMLRINGLAKFEFRDMFEDPLDLGIEPGGSPYAITGNWSALFRGEVFANAERSDYTSGRSG